MRSASLAVLALVVVPVVATACKKDDPPPNPQPGAGIYTGAGTQPGYGPQPGAPYSPQPGAPGQPAVAPGQPVAGGTLAVPGPQALACTNDSPCMSHKCNVQYGKCAFPCETDFDCQPSFSCVKSPLGAACLPKMPGQP